MSAASETARRILDGSADGGRRVDRPHDYDLRVAETYAAIAQAEALERLAKQVERFVGLHRWDEIA